MLTNLESKGLHGSSGADGARRNRILKAGFFGLHPRMNLKGLYDNLDSSLCNKFIITSFQGKEYLYEVQIDNILRSMLNISFKKIEVKKADVNRRRDIEQNTIKFLLRKNDASTLNEISSKSFDYTATFRFQMPQGRGVLI